MQPAREERQMQSRLWSAYGLREGSTRHAGQRMCRQLRKTIASQTRMQVFWTAGDQRRRVQRSGWHLDGQQRSVCYVESLLTPSVYRRLGWRIAVVRVFVCKGFHGSIIGDAKARRP